ncbi:MAG: colicin E5-related ribonuclease [Brevundimonas sp.]|uniref:colicin E5-related ribonuclease n=1 Tax=Brevundimonas sp. TaxID=1871086 RepID=UPI00391B42B9
MVKRPEKLRRQMVGRGWTDDQIAEAVSKGVRVSTANRETDRPATRYIHPVTGRSVVIEDESGEIIHVGGDGFIY